jgi:hypothetical protein
MNIKYLSLFLMVVGWTIILLQIGYSVGFWKTNVTTFMPHHVVESTPKLPSEVLAEETRI